MMQSRRKAISIVCRQQIRPAYCSFVWKAQTITNIFYEITRGWLTTCGITYLTSEIEQQNPLVDNRSPVTSLALKLDKYPLQRPTYTLQPLQRTVSKGEQKAVNLFHARHFEGNYQFFGKITCSL